MAGCRAAAGLAAHKLHTVLEVDPSFPFESFGYRHRRRRAQRDELTNLLDRNLVDVPRKTHTATTPTPDNELQKTNVQSGAQPKQTETEAEQLQHATVRVVLLSVCDLVLRRWIRVHSEKPSLGDAADKGIAAEPSAGTVPDRLADLKSPVSRAAALVQERDSELVDVLFPPDGHRSASIGWCGLQNVSHRTNGREGEGAAHGCGRTPSVTVCVRTALWHA